jgi:hypothetical protein
MDAYTPDMMDRLDRMDCSRNDSADADGGVSFSIAMHDCEGREHSHLMLVDPAHLRRNLERVLKQLTEARDTLAACDALEQRSRP